MIAYYCLREYGMLPATYANMDTHEKSFTIACVEQDIENERKAHKEMKRKKR